MTNGKANLESERRQQRSERDANWERVRDDANRGHAAQVLADAEARRAEAETARLAEKRLAMIEKRLADLEALVKKLADAR